MYLGQSYQGFARQDMTDNTIEVRVHTRTHTHTYTHARAYTHVINTHTEA